MTNMSIAARIVLPFPKPGARLELEINEPLGLHVSSEKNNKKKQTRNLRKICHRALIMMGWYNLYFRLQ